MYCENSHDFLNMAILNLLTAPLVKDQTEQHAQKALDFNWPQDQVQEADNGD